MKILQIVSSAYRATLEEQDDTVLWLTQMLRASGADVGVLLQASAVNYAVATQDAGALVFGDWRQSHPPNIAGTIAALLREGVHVYAIEEDLAARGIGEELCVAGIRRLPRVRMAELFDRFERVWQW
jgi:hypothetical protein